MPGGDFTKLNKRNQTKFLIHKPVTEAGRYGDVKRRYPGLEGDIGSERVFAGSLQPVSQSGRNAAPKANIHGLSMVSEFVVYTTDTGAFSVLDRISVMCSNIIYEITAVTSWPGFTTLFVKEV